MRTLGPYKLSRCIGAGGMAEVWLAQKRAASGASKTVAIKRLARAVASQQQYRDMFFAEARLSMALNNSNIVQVFDFGEDNGECYLAMEWIDGPNLSDLEMALWEAGFGISLEVALYIVGEVLRALDHAHTMVHEGASSIVHRDVSPANILLSTAGEVKLTDFGVARFASEETSGEFVKGKLRYMPLEQLEGNSKEGTVDLYAVGAVLHEMLDGRKFRGQVEESQLYRMILQGVMPELVNPSGVPAQVDALRRQLLEPQVSRRVSSARDALQLLQQCPGYRSAALELAQLVRWYRGLQPGSPGYQAPRFAESELPDEQTADTSISRKDISAFDSTTSRSPLPITRRQQRAAALTLVLAGLSLGCLGVVFAINTWSPNANAQEAEPTTGTQTRPAEPEFEPPIAPENQTPDSAPKSEPAPTPEPAPKSEPEPTSEPEPKPEPAPTPEPIDEPSPGLDPPVIDDESDPPPAPPAVVKFKAGAHRFAYVKVAGKQLLIEPDGGMKISPGTHPVSVRFDKSAKWVSFGSIKVQSGRSYVVELTKPKGVKVTAQK